ncbi:uncharacterized protein LOC124164590 isoform X2 [Ischnura elegans]|uniref:uncharacterized protein LOC124164590 isoform X2 n=1 Tax=Ischnura elegans TaxID=197161 RepID=UPI001ED889A3|nr:uncharacterized protein LOC124164590 isoform X2 [Ischnura elegans]
MFEGKHIHFSPVDNKPLCSYSKKICKQRRLNGYAFCIRHILEDGSAPFKQCSFIAKFKKCTNPIPSHEDRGYCNSHMQVAGMLPKKVRQPSKKEKGVGGKEKSGEEPHRIWKGSNLPSGHTTIILPSSLTSDVGKLKFSDRLKALLKTGGGQHGVSIDEEAEAMEAMIEMGEEAVEEDEGDSTADQMDYDPYAFSEPEPIGKVVNFGDANRLKSSGDSMKYGRALVQPCRVSPASIAARKLKPVKHHSVDSGSNGHRSIVPASIRPSLSIPLAHNDGISLSAESSSETMNRLAAKIAADKVLGKHHRKFRPPLSKRSEETSESSPSHSSSSSSSSPHHKTSSAPDPPPLHPASRPRPHLMHTARPSNSPSGSHSRQSTQPVVHRRPSNTALGAVATSGPARRLPFHGSSSLSSPPSAVTSVTPVSHPMSVKSPTRVFSLSNSSPQLVALSAATTSATAAATAATLRKDRSLLEEQLMSTIARSDHSSPRRHGSVKGATEVSQQSPRGSRVKTELLPPPSPGSPGTTTSTPRRSRSSHRPITYRAPSSKPHPIQAQPPGGTNPSEGTTLSSNSTNVITIPSRRCKGGRSVVELVKSLSTDALRNVQDVWEGMRLYKQDLYPLGFESSETEGSDSEPECGFYQRHWFTPPFDYHVSSSSRLSPSLNSSYHSHHDLKPRAKVKALLARTSSSSESRCFDERRYHGPINHPASLADVGARGVAYDEWKARGFGKIPCPMDMKGSHSSEKQKAEEATVKVPLSLRDQRLLRMREDLRRRCGQIGGACSLLGRSRRRAEIKAEIFSPKLEPGVKLKVEPGVEENIPVEGEAWQEHMVRAVISAVRKSGPNRTGALLRDGLRLIGGKKGVNRPHTRHRNRSKLTMLVTRTCAYRCVDTGESDGGESGEEEKKPKAGGSSKANSYCGSPALPCTRHCPRHVMYNVDQLLFEHCTAKFADNTQCCAPVFDVSRDTPLCPEHARKRDNYDRMCAEIKPKRARKKAKPSAMTRPSKRGKKKRRSASVPVASVEQEDHIVKEEHERTTQYSSPLLVSARRTELGKSNSLSPSRRETLDDDASKEGNRHAASMLLSGVLGASRVRHKADEDDDAEQGDLDDDEEVASALSGACPDEDDEDEEEEEDDGEDDGGDIEEATLAAAAESLAAVDDDVEEVDGADEVGGVDGVVEEEAIASVLGVTSRNHRVEVEVVEEEVDGLPLLDPSEELGNQASRLLEEHDLTNVLNQIPPEAFNDLFIGKNGEYEPTREETEELERALEAVDKDVKSLEKLSRQGGAGASNGAGVVVVGGGPIVGATEVVGADGGSATAGLDLDSILDEHTLHQIATSGGHPTSGVGNGVVGIPLSQMVVTSQGRMPENSMCGTIPSMAGLPGGTTIAGNGVIGGVAMLGDSANGVTGLVPGMHIVNGTTNEGGIAPLFCSQNSQNAAISAVHASTYDLLHHSSHLDASVGQMAPVAGPGAYITAIQSTNTHHHTVTTPTAHPTPTHSTVLATSSQPSASSTAPSNLLAFNGGDGVLQPQAGLVASSFVPSQIAYSMTPGYPNGYIVDNPAPPSQLVSVQKQHLLQQQNHFVPMNQVPQSFEHFIGGNQMAVEVEVATGIKRPQEHQVIDHNVVSGPVDALDLFGSGGIVDAASLFASPTPGMVAPPTVVTTSVPHPSPSATHLTSQQHQMLMLAAAAAESDAAVSEMGS